MRNFILSIAIYFLTQSAFAGNGIVVQQKYVGNGTNANIVVTWHITADNCKMTMKFGDDKVKSSITHFIPQNGNLLMYAEGEVPQGTKKTYFSTPIDKIKSPADANPSRVAVTKTGETKELGGFVCEKYIVKTNKSEAEIWVTKTVKFDLYKFYPYFPGNTDLMALHAENIQGVPLESVTKDLTGKVISRYELLSAQEKNLGETDFKVPAEYSAP